MKTEKVVSHTPTPWIINEVFKDKGGTLPAYQVYSNGQFVCETNSRSEAETIVKAVNEYDSLKAQKAALLEAAERLITQFKVIGMNQHRLLVRGQDFESASKNWEEATTGQVLEFEPLMKAIDQAEGGK